jgi:translation initiation factor 6
VGDTGQQAFYEFVSDQLFDGVMPIVLTTICGNANVGSMAVGNSRGLLVPAAIEQAELEEIQMGLTDGVEVGQVRDSLNALGNCIVCNDSVALVHPDLSADT